MRRGVTSVEVSPATIRVAGAVSRRGAKNVRSAGRLLL
jgi:hypothetical protein